MHSRSACSARRGLSGRPQEAQHTLSVGTAPLSFPKPQQLAWEQPWEAEPQAGTCGQRAGHDLHVLQGMGTVSPSAGEFPSVTLDEY